MTSPATSPSASPADKNDLVEGDPRPRIGVTFGDPAGIGPEVAAKLLAHGDALTKADVMIFASVQEFENACTVAGVSIPLATKPGVGAAVLLDEPGPVDVAWDKIAPGEPSEQAGAWALHHLRSAVDAAVTDRIDGFLFAPLNKTSLHLAGMHAEDELRWFSSLLDYRGTTSELNAIDGLWTARVTSHMALREVADRVTTSSVLAAVDLLRTALIDFGISAPRLAVAALNPHAGENGSFGREEIDEITPAVVAAQEHGWQVSGPFPCDTVFLAARRGEFDGVVTMYHDQGQIAMKSIGFDQGVTIQGGLPIVITTPAHGTAFPIVGRGVANWSAIDHAFRLATKLAIGRRRRLIDGPRR